MFNYLNDHWAGRQKLWRSFWINVVVIGLIVLFTVRRFVPLVIDKSPTYISLLITIAVVLSLICAIWQIVGVFRACQRELQGTAVAGDSILIYSMVIGYGFILSTSLIDFSRFVLPSNVESVSGLTTRIIHPYEESPGNLLIDGTIDFGLTRQLEKILQTETGIRRLILNSHGGVVSEARGIVRLIREHNLSTHVASECYSACTLVFVGADQRSIAPEGRLGFHRYRLNSMGYNPGVDASEQHVIDSELLASQGVSKAFVERAYEEPHSGLWIPSVTELVKSGVVTTIEPGELGQHSENLRHSHNE